MEPNEQARLLDESKDDIDAVEDDTFPAAREAVHELEAAIQSVKENPESETTLRDAQMLADKKLHSLDNTRGRGIQALNAAAEELVGPADMMSSWADTGALSETLRTIFNKYEALYFAFTWVDSSRIDTPVSADFLDEAERRIADAKEALNELEQMFPQARSEFPDEAALRRDLNNARREREQRMVDEMAEFRDSSRDA